MEVYGLLLFVVVEVQDALHCENMRFDLVVLTYHTRSDKYLTDQGQTSDAPLNSSTVTQGLRPHHFVQVFVLGNMESSNIDGQTEVNHEINVSCNLKE